MTHQRIQQTPTDEQQSELLELTDAWCLSRILQLPVREQIKLPHQQRDHTPLIVVFGAFRGKLLQWFAEKTPQGSHLVGYEPQKWAYNETQSRLEPYHERGTHQIEIHNYGLEVEVYDPNPVTRVMGEWNTDSCSLLADTREHGTGEFRDAYTTLASLVLDHQQAIDLLVMNCEGYEWRLVPYLLEQLHRHQIPPSFAFKSLAIQWHMQYAPSVSEQGYILHTLDEAYDKHFNYYYPSWSYHYTNLTMES